MRNQPDSDNSGPNPDEDPKLFFENMFIAPPFHSTERIGRLGLPTQGSEDVSHLLVPPDLPSEGPGEQVDYRPDDQVDWGLDVEFTGDPLLDRSRIEEIFHRDWCSRHGRPVLYGWSPKQGHWTFLHSADSPEQFCKLSFGWSLYDTLAPDEFQITSSQLRGYQEGVLEQARKLGNPHLSSNMSPEQAVRTARMIKQLVQRCHKEVVIILAAPPGALFPGDAIWDVMHCLGLSWGDMDIFHWNNPSLMGDDSFFSVWTSTPPGYFFPEEIAAGRVRVADLIFGFSIPRSVHPVAVFQAMVKAVNYSQSRLGGILLDSAGSGFSAEVMLKDIEKVTQRLVEAGFQPGKGATLRIF